MLYLYQSQGAAVGFGEVSMMANFYAFYNKYGVDSRDSDNERIGTVVVFTSRAARNKWVNADELRNGSHHCEPITAREARCEMVRVAYDDLLNRHIVFEPGDLKYVSMGTLTRAYCRAML